jgi:hypothetical protein
VLVVVRAVRGVTMLAMDEVVVVLVRDERVAATRDVDVHVRLVRQVRDRRRGGQALDMVVAGVMQLAVVEVIDMVAVEDGRVAAPGMVSVAMVLDRAMRPGAGPADGAWSLGHIRTVAEHALRVRQMSWIGRETATSDKPPGVPPIQRAHRDTPLSAIMCRTSLTAATPALGLREGYVMGRSVTDLAREVIERVDRGEPLDEALSMALSTSEIDDETRGELETKGLRDAVVHEAFHELLEWHADFGGLPEFIEIDEAIHRMAERIGHDMEGQSRDRDTESGPRLLH